MYSIIELDSLLKFTKENRQKYPWGELTLNDVVFNLQLGDKKPISSNVLVQNVIERTQKPDDEQIENEEKSKAEDVPEINERKEYIEKLLIKLENDGYIKITWVAGNILARFKITTQGIEFIDDGGYKIKEKIRQEVKKALEKRAELEVKILREAYAFNIKTRKIAVWGFSISVITLGVALTIIHILKKEDLLESILPF